MEMGRPILPPFIGSRRDRLDEEPWDFYYPIDIQVSSELKSQAVLDQI